MYIYMIYLVPGTRFPFGIVVGLKSRGGVKLKREKHRAAGVRSQLNRSPTQWYFCTQQTNTKTPKTPRVRQAAFISDGESCQRVVARVVSNLNQLIRLRNTSGIVKVFPTAIISIIFIIIFSFIIIIDAVEKEVSPPPRRHRR